MVNPTIKARPNAAEPNGSPVSGSCDSREAAAAGVEADGITVEVDVDVDVEVDCEGEAFFVNRAVSVRLSVAAAP